MIWTRFKAFLGKAWGWVALVAGVVAGLFVWLWRRERSERIRAEAARDAERVIAEERVKQGHAERAIAEAERGIRDETDRDKERIRGEIDAIREDLRESEKEIRDKASKEGGAGEAFNDAFNLPD